MLKGIGVSSGIGIGTAVFIGPPKADYSHVVPSTPSEESQKLSHAIQNFVQKTRIMAQNLEGQAGSYQAQILLAQIQIAEDPFLIQQVEDFISQGYCAEQALDLVCQMFIQTLSSTDDPLMAQRAVDIQDLRTRILMELLGLEAVDLSTLPPASVLVAQELTPSMTATLNPSHIAGILTETGASTSHCAILARAMGLPAVLSIPEATTQIHTGDTVIVDGDSGIALLHPEDAVLTQYRARQQVLQQEKSALFSYANCPTITADGHKVALYGNIGTQQQAQQVSDATGEGIGLFRTEFLFMDHTPTEEEQFQTYRQVLETMGTREVIIRTLDVGGDKDIPSLGLEEEANPFLGLRGIRYCLSHKEVFLSQLRALVRASAYGNLRIMLPMVSTVEELRQSKQLFMQIKEEFDQTGVPYNRDLKLGIMVETPSALLMADLLAQEADFFSIGTNDLTQYIMAADRGNPAVQSLCSPYHPAMLRAILYIIQSGHRFGISVGMCGEAAANPELIPLLLGFGLDEFSVSPSLILQTRKAIAQWTLEQAEALAQSALRCVTEEEILALLHTF